MLFIASDHAGFNLKNVIIKYCKNKNLAIRDLGVFAESSIDYPDVALVLCEEILESRGILESGKSDSINKDCFNKNSRALESLKNSKDSIKGSLDSRNSQRNLGILVCGSGIGMSIAANRYKHIRAALCLNSYMARVARQHNDANVLCLGERVVGVDLALEIVETFLGTGFEQGRHIKRVEKLSKINDSAT